MKYQKAINIWNMSDSEIKKLQSGQWVYGADIKNKGMFLGMKKSGTIVVAWLGNASKQANYDLVDCGYSLADDILANAAANRWDNFNPGDDNYEYYKSKADVYKLIVDKLSNKKLNLYNT